MAFQGDSIFWVEVEKIVPNPYQPRREFDESKLKELSESIRMYGILQPLTVTRREITREDGAFFTEYELIAGERRLRASKIAGLVQVPVIIREGENNEQEKLELAIIENLQREDLNAIDRALAFKQLIDMFSLSHSQVAKKVGRSREYVSNSLRLLLLPEHMLDAVKRGDLSEGHARTLLMLNDRPQELETLFREVLLKKLSVREVERIARKIATDKVRNEKYKNIDPNIIEFEKQFTETLGTRVQIAKTDFGGRMTIDYFSDEDLEKMLAMLRAERASEPVRHTEALTDQTLAESAAEDQAFIDKLAANTPLEQPSAVPSEPANEDVYASSPERAPEPAPADPEQSEAPVSPSPTHTPALESESEARPIVPAPAQTAPAEEKKKEESDESELYTIKNFSI